METIETKNAIITSSEIMNADRSILEACLYLDYEVFGQGFGGYALYLPKSYNQHELKSVAGHFIWRVMEVADVKKWSELAGKAIRVKASPFKVHAIGHIIKDDWFCPSDDFKSLLTQKES